MQISSKSGYKYLYIDLVKLLTSGAVPCCCLCMVVCFTLGKFVIGTCIQSNRQVWIAIHFVKHEGRKSKEMCFSGIKDHLLS